MTAQKLTLYAHPRVAVRELREPAAGVDGYVYTDWYGGRPVVAVLPYRITAARELELCLTDERVPCWEENGLSAVTGTPQEPDPVDDAVRELWEETGYRIHRDQLVSLGWCRDSKGSSTRYQLYAVDVTGLEPEDRVGDGSRLEAEAACVWIGLAQLPLVGHAQAHTMVVRLLAHLAATGPAIAAGQLGAPSWTAAFRPRPAGGHEPGA